VSRPTDRYAQTMFCAPSFTVADELSCCPTRRLSSARSGIVGAVNAARPTPIQLVAGWSAFDSAYRPGARGWIKIKNRDYWRYEIERESAINVRRERMFV
jgi:hypothetical protein